MQAALWIYRKELREMLRDKRVRSGAFVMPIMMVFLILALFGFLTNTLSDTQNMKLHVIGSGPMVDQLKKSKATILTIPTVEEAEARIKSGDVHLAIQFPSGVAEPGKQVVIRIYFDPKDQKAQVMATQVQRMFDEQNQQILQQTLVAHNIPKEAAEPIKFELKPITIGNQQSASDLVIQILPYLIVVYAFYGGMGSVGDLVAGEKEKMTLETLLISPVSRRDIALGKFLALATLCLASSLSAVAGLIIAGALNLKMMAKVFPHGLGLTPLSVVLVVFALLPAVVLFASIMLAVSTKAKNMREAQTQLTLLSLVILMPAMFSQFIGYTDWANAWWINAIPVLNTSSGIRHVLLGKPDVAAMGLGFAVNGVIGVIAMVIAIRLFQKEEVLVRV